MVEYGERPDGRPVTETPPLAGATQGMSGPAASGPDKAAARTDSGTLPSLSLPKGGGAIRGIGEKFSINPVTGTGTMAIPVSLSPGRSGFSPEITLTYNSGTGNSPF